MTTEVLSRTVTAAVPTYFGQGRIWYLKTASGPVTIECRKSGQGSTNRRRFVNVAAGFKFTAEMGDGWDTIQLDSATSQNIEMIVGDDDVEVSNAVSVTGSVTTAESPFATFAPAADVAVGATGSTLLAANLSRRAIVIGNFSTNSPATLNLRVSSVVASRGVELQPGTWIRIPTTADVYVHNPDANVQSIWTYEEV